MMKFEDTHSEHRRDDDKMRVDHVIPLPWLLGLVGAILLWAAVQHFGLQNLAEKLSQASDSVKTLSAQVQALSGEVSKQNIRAVEY